MKYKLTLLILIICYTQGISQNKITVIPLSFSDIETDRKTERNLRFNQVSTDSIKTFIFSETIRVFKQSISNQTEVNIENSFIYSDSLETTTTSRKNARIDSLNGAKRFIVENENLATSNYQSRQLTETFKNQLKDLFTDPETKHIVIFNKFETTTPSPFCNKTTFSIHIDIYDRSLNKVYGGKSVFKQRITKKMYHSTMEYYVTGMLEQYFLKFEEL